MSISRTISERHWLWREEWKDEFHTLPEETKKRYGSPAAYAGAQMRNYKRTLLIIVATPILLAIIGSMLFPHL